MKTYDNFFLPVEDMAQAKAFYGEVLGLKTKFEFPDSGMAAYRVGQEEPAIILKDRKKFPDAKPTIWFEVEDVRTVYRQLREKVWFSCPSPSGFALAGRQSSRTPSATAWASPIT